MIGIYKITNKITKEAYIGQSVQIEERFTDHKNPTNWNREKNKKLYQAFRDFGLNNFNAAKILKDEEALARTILMILFMYG